MRSRPWSANVHCSPRRCGKPGSGASVEFKIKEGPITMLSVGVTTQGKFKFIIAEGESVHGPIPATGPTGAVAGSTAARIRFKQMRSVSNLLLDPLIQSHRRDAILAQNGFEHGFVSQIGLRFEEIPFPLF